MLGCSKFVDNFVFGSRFNKSIRIKKKSFKCFYIFHFLVRLRVITLLLPFCKELRSLTNLMFCRDFDFFSFLDCRFAGFLSLPNSDAVSLEIVCIDDDDDWRFTNFFIFPTNSTSEESSVMRMRLTTGNFG